MIAQWISQALAHAGMSKAALGRALTVALGRSIDRAAVSKMTTGQRRIAADEMVQIALITGFPPPAETGQPSNQGARTPPAISQRWILHGNVRALSSTSIVVEPEDLTIALAGALRELEEAGRAATPEALAELALDALQGAEAARHLVASKLLRRKETVSEELVGDNLTTSHKSPGPDHSSDS